MFYFLLESSENIVKTLKQSWKKLKRSRTNIKKALMLTNVEKMSYHNNFKKMNTNKVTKTRVWLENNKPMLRIAPRARDQNLFGPIVTAFAFTHSSLARHGDDDDGKFVTFISSKVRILYWKTLKKCLYSSLKT